MKTPSAAWKCDPSEVCPKAIIPKCPHKKISFTQYKHKHRDISIFKGGNLPKTKRLVGDLYAFYIRIPRRD